MKGSLEILVKIHNNGTFEVDDANDVMLIGRHNGLTLGFVEGDGSFDVFAGVLRFRNIKLLSGGSTPMALNVSGGEIELANYDVQGQVAVDWDVNITGGTFDVDRSFETSGDLDMSGGTADIGADFDIGGSLDLSAGTLLIAYEDEDGVTVTGDINISGGTLQVDGQFTGKGELDFSGGMIKVAAGKIAAFTPND